MQMTAVAVGCFLTLVGCFGVGCAPTAAGLAFVLMLVEAVSPHGLDNLTLPIASAALLRPLLAAGWL